jgi:dihydrofolate synthase/folylpolyglutamate synthase
MARPLETYEQAIEFLYGRINYERAPVESYTSSDFKLERMQRLLAALGNPQERLPAIHVAGTKGKGSTCNMIAAVLTAAGLRTGLYTSPHLVRFEERMTVDGISPTPEELVQLVNQVHGPVSELDRLPLRSHPTYFEIATALAWLDFERRRADVAVLETGLGGRLDSTNLCRPWVTVITNVSRDHMQILGSTVREIAVEKAGIIKPGVPVISGALHPDAEAVIAERANHLQAPLWQLGRDVEWEWSDGTEASRHVDVRTPRRLWRRLPITLRGAHQAVNTALAVAALDRLSDVGIVLSCETAQRGLRQVRWPGRIEVLSQRPHVVLDAAHNWESTKALVKTLREEFGAVRRRILVFATTRDKDYRGLIRQLVPAFDTLIFTRYLDNPRAVPAEELCGYLSAISERQAHLAPDPYSAWKLARRLSHPHDLIVVTGSFFLVGELRELIREDLRSSAANASTDGASSRTVQQPATATNTSPENTP